MINRCRFCFNFAFKFELRRYTEELTMLRAAVQDSEAEAAASAAALVGRCRLTPG
jgi:hypothetical protein